MNLVNDVHPGKDREAVRNWAGQIADNFDEDDYRHRFPVDWRVRPIRRADLSPEFQKTMRSPLTVASLRHHVPEFLRLVNE